MFYIINDPSDPSSGIVLMDRKLLGYTPYGQMQLSKLIKCSNQENFAILLPNLIVHDTLYLYGVMKGQNRVSVIWDDTTVTHLPNVETGFLLPVPKAKLPVRVEVYSAQQTLTQYLILKKEACVK